MCLTLGIVEEDKEPRNRELPGTSAQEGGRQKSRVG